MSIFKSKETDEGHTIEMKAARFVEVGEKVIVERIPISDLTTGTVRVRTLYAGVSNSFKNLLTGKMPVPIPIPYTPGTSNTTNLTSSKGSGSIAVVEEFSKDVYGLEKGQLVYCSPWFVSPQTKDGLNPNSLIIGLLAVSPTAKAITDLYKNGGWAEYQVLPSQCVFPIPNSLRKTPLRSLYYIKYLCISMGALTVAKVGLGSVLLVNGATGRYGAGCVRCGLALGCKKIFCVARDAKKLKSLFGKEKRCVLVTDESKLPTTECDAVVDFLGSIQDNKLVERTFKCVKFGGNIVCAGGVRASIDIPYQTVVFNNLNVSGSLMYTKEDVFKVISLVECGHLPLSKLSGSDYSLKKINEAIDKAYGDNQKYIGIKF